VEVTVVGMGRMGAAFARRAHSQGFSVYWWNRTRDKVRDAPGVEVGRLEDARGLVAVFVSDDEALYAVVERLGGDYVALAGTYSISAVKRAVELLESKGRRAFAMPVVGNPKDVEDGSAVYLVGAPEELYAHLRPHLEKLGVLLYVGDSVRAAALKLAFNSLLFSTVVALGESISLALKYGISVDTFRELLMHTAFRGVVLRYMDRMLGRTAPVFTMRNAAKDMRYASIAAGEAGVGDIVMSSVKALYDLLSALGYGDEDCARAGLLEGGALSNARPPPL